MPITYQLQEDKCKILNLDIGINKNKAKAVNFKQNCSSDRTERFIYRIKNIALLIYNAQ